jgi:hypothetical protein
MVRLSGREMKTDDEKRTPRTTPGFCFADALTFIDCSSRVIAEHKIFSRNHLQFRKRSE